MELPSCETTNALAELIDERIQSLLGELHGTFNAQNVQAELQELDRLLGSFRQNDEHLERLLSEQTTKYEREALIAELRAQKRAISENRATLERLHARSHELMLQSARLIANSRRRFEKLTRIHGDYASELCAHCKGLGRAAGSDTGCIACKGFGTVLVHQPPIKCPRCNGKGNGSNHSTDLFHSALCLVCQGTGWVMVINGNESRARVSGSS